MLKSLFLIFTTQAEIQPIERKEPKPNPSFNLRFHDTKIPKPKGNQSLSGALVWKARLTTVNGQNPA